MRDTVMAAAALTVLGVGNLFPGRQRRCHEEACLHGLRGFLLTSIRESMTGRD